MNVGFPPGWYPCPSDNTQFQFWNGVAWTNDLLQRSPHRTPVPVPAAPPVPVPAAYATAWRRPDATVLANVIPLFFLVPLSLACVAPVVAVLADQSGLSPLVFQYAWLFGWLPLTLIPVQRAMGDWFFGVRRLTAAEEARVGVAWRDVVSRSGHPPGRFLLRVSDDNHSANAAASGGHIVSVTTCALGLPRHDLAAILAHELGHHLALHPVVALITYWLTLPVRGWIALLELTMRASAAVVRAVAGAGSGWFTLVVVGVVLWCRFYAAVLRAIVAVLGLLVSATNRRAEYLADRYAVDLGYGPPLRHVLSTFVGRGLDLPSNASLWQRLSSSHPPLRSRIDRIDRMLVSPQQGP